MTALKENLDVKAVRTLRFVSDPESLVYTNDGKPAVDPDALLPVLAIPAANQCPSSYQSQNFDRAASQPGTEAFRKAQTDWRCSDRYVNEGSFGDGRGHIVVGTADDLGLILGASPSVAARQALTGGGAVSLYPEYVADGQVTIDWRKASYWQEPSPDARTLSPVQSKHLTAVVDEPAYPIWFGIVISPATADKLGLHYAAGSVLASTKTPPTQAQIDAVNGAIDTVIQSPGAYSAQVERGPQHVADAFSWGILGLSALIAIGAAAVAIGLARFDGRRDQTTLNAIGSSPGVRRGFGFWQAIVLAGTGAVLGAAVGLVPAIALTLPGSGTMFAAPWLPIVATATLMPLAIACGSWLIAGRRKVELRRAAIE